jgi:hypothetical protein
MLLNVESIIGEWEIRLAMKLATLGFFYVTSGNLTTWHQQDLVISSKFFFEFYNSLVARAKFLLCFGDFLPKKNSLHHTIK